MKSRGRLQHAFMPAGDASLKTAQVNQNAIDSNHGIYRDRPRCKRNLTYLRSVRVQPCMRPVFRVEACPVAMQPLWLLALM